MDNFPAFLYDLRDKNAARFGTFKNSKGVVVNCEAWTHNDWIGALVGEMGEAAEIVDAIHRRGAPYGASGEEVAALGSEIADIETYLDILAMRLNIDLVSALEFHGSTTPEITWMSGWSASDYLAAMLKDVGRIANWLKKVLRGDVDLYTVKDGQTIRWWIEKSIAGIQANLGYLAQGSRIDLVKATVAKWNKVSEKIDSPLRLA